MEDNKNCAFKNLIIRVRENKKKKNGEERIAYYGGYKAFELNDGKYKLSDSLFKANYTEIRDKDDINEQVKNKKELLENIIKNNMNISFSLNKIIIKSASNFDYKKFENLVKDKKKLKHFNASEKTKLINSKIEDENGKFTYELKFDDDITNLEEMLYREYEIMYDLKKNYDYSFIGAPIFYPNGPTLSGEITEDELIKTIKRAISSYKGKDSEEKKYQHTFMLNAINEKNLENFFKLDNSEGLFYFEQEYGITNCNPSRSDKPNPSKKADYKQGRIDSIFYNIKNNDNKVISDIYLIELKIDDGVIGGENGVYTHLDDVDSLFACDNKNKLIDKFNQINDLKKNIKYRYENFDNVGSKLSEDYGKNTKIHFYTVFAYTDINLKNKIKKFIEDAKRDGITDYKYSVKGKNGRFNLLDLKTSDKYDVEFFFDDVKKEFIIGEDDKIFKNEEIKLKKWDKNE